MSQQRSRGRRGGPRRRPRVSFEQSKPPKHRSMLVEGSGERTHIAVIEDGELVEHYAGRRARRTLAGNIYLGVVQNVLAGMEAAFVDIGQPRNAVLYPGDLSIEADELEAGSQPRIEQVLKPGMPVLVQVTKDPMGTKGARLTMQLSVAGRYLVVVPHGSGYGISRRLPDAERIRLREVAKAIRPDGFGVIVRTAAEGASRDELERDLSRLVRLWEEIDKRSASAKPPVEIYVEPDLVLRVVRDIFSKEYDELVVSDPGTYEKIARYLDAVDAELRARLRLHEGPLSLFDAFHVSEQLRKALERKIWLKSGGQIVVDRTEALTVVDVNTARFVGRTSLEDTVVRTNLEAAEEVVRQLRLRDIGGIIIIDFIDMLLLENREEVLRAFRQALTRDKTKTQVIGISPLGLVEMTRKNVSEGLVEALTTPCPMCEGRGVVIEDAALREAEHLETTGRDAL